MWTRPVCGSRYRIVKREQRRYDLSDLVAHILAQVGTNHTLAIMNNRCW